MQNVTISSSNLVQSRLIRMLEDYEVPDEQIYEEILRYFQEHGGGGTSEGYFYDRNSIVASAWIINHNLNKYPQVTLIDDDGNEIEADIFYGTLNQVTVTFAQPTSGKAVLI